MDYSCCVCSVIKICADVLPYMCLLVTILFGCSFMFLNLSSEATTQTAKSDSGSLLFAGFASNLVYSMDVLLGWEQTKFERPFGIVIFYIFLFYVQLVMLNILIAVMVGASPRCM